MVNQLTWNGITLRFSARKDGGEYVSPCPFCGGHDRFHVWPATDRYWCRQCDAKGDSIDYVRRLNPDLNYREALALLGRSEPPRYRSGGKTQGSLVDREYKALSDSEWQDNAREFCRLSFDRLWDSQGAKALSYLIERGIKDHVIEQAGLGFNPTDTKTKWGETEVYLPRGIVIPWLIGGRLWRVNVRRATGEPKYQQIAGGANGLYNADEIDRFQSIVMVEGEFDCLVLQSHVKGIVPVATGTVSWARQLRWITLVNTAQEVILAFDVDQNGAGDNAVKWWKEQLGSKAIRIAPTEHDITDMWKAGKDLQQWLEPHTLWYEREITQDDLNFRSDIENEMQVLGYIRI